MPTLLQLDSSADLTGSNSRAIAASFARAWRECSTAHTVTYRDLHTEPLPHLPDPALHWAPRLRRPADPAPAAAAEQLQQRLIAELLAADVLLIGVPLYNYSMPSTLKVWLDYIHVLGTTAAFDGNRRPVKGRPAVLVTSRGASYDAGTPSADWDHAVPPLQLVLGGALGMDVQVITTSLTLAGRIPAMAAQLGRSQDELSAAHDAAGRLGSELGAAASVPAAG